jgi:NuA3 HAT complex component NTO1
VKRLRNKQKKMSPFSGCFVCIDPEISENPIYNCNSCGVRIHALCYGIDVEAESQDNWLCSPCKSEFTGTMRCEFCPKSDGVFKRTSCGKWIHVICALFTDGVQFEDNNSMEPVDVSRVSKKKT